MGQEADEETDVVQGGEEGVAVWGIPVGLVDESELLAFHRRHDGEGTWLLQLSPCQLYLHSLQPSQFHRLRFSFQILDRLPHVRTYQLYASIFGRVA